jgi:histidinol-phosphatase (PHP family)
MHMHSEFSTDSQTPMKQQIEAALQRGLAGICFTDHMDYEFPSEAVSLSDLPSSASEKASLFVFDDKCYIRQISKWQEEFPMLQIETGVECGLQPAASVISSIRALVQQPEWDFIIGSVHLVDGMDPYYPAFWEGKNPSQCIRRYFEIIWECLKHFSEFDSLGHMDYVVRYAPADFVYNPADYQDITEEIMKYIIRKDIALEVNSSGLFGGRKRENPHPDLLKQYVRLGGELVTVGSDAHIPERVAGGFDTLERHLKEAGLHHYVTYRKRKPVFQTINV